VGIKELIRHCFWKMARHSESPWYGEGGEGRAVKGKGGKERGRVLVKMHIPGPAPLYKVKSWDDGARDLGFSEVHPVPQVIEGYLSF
jgi:hypothetical protein